MGMTKKELADALDWSRPRLDRWLATHPDFPVIRRGARGGGWEFDKAAVHQYLGTGGEEPNELSFAARSLRGGNRNAS